jgi:hypothetical protein
LSLFGSGVAGLVRRRTAFGWVGVTEGLELMLGPVMKGKKRVHVGAGHLGPGADLVFGQHLATGLDLGDFGLAPARPELARHSAAGEVGGAANRPKMSGERISGSAGWGRHSCSFLPSL